MEKLEDFLLKEIVEIAKQLEINYPSSIRKQELIDLIREEMDKKEGMFLAWGTLDIINDGYGFLRKSNLGNDIYVSASQIKKFKLRTGDFILGEVRDAIQDEKNYGLRKIILVNRSTLEEAQAKISFDDLIPAYPTEHLKLETNPENISGRMIDLIAPIGKGQRGLIVAPPKAGKTVLITDIANSILENNKEVEVWILLIDERPEEVTDIKENVKGAQVFASTFDDDPKNHIKVTETLLDKAKRKIENGEDVVILMDSLTRLARAYNIVTPSSGKLISGGIDPISLYYPKKFFGSARNIRNGGSLTIIATALIETGSKMDEVIYEEFKGTGNLDIQLDRNLSQLRIYPAIDIQKSGTRKEELLIEKKKLNSIWEVRRALATLDKVAGTKQLVDLIKSTESNEKLVELFKNKAALLRGK